MTREEMEFPETFEKFAKEYGFKDDKEVYTNGSDLIPIFRVKQWLEHYNKLCTIETDTAYECSGKCSDNCKVKNELDREEAIIHIETLRTVIKDIPKYSGKAIDKAVEMAVEALKQKPKTGHWIRELIRNEKGGCIGAKMICSECGNDNKHDEYMDYCPNCGFRMV